MIRRTWTALIVTSSLAAAGLAAHAAINSALLRRPTDSQLTDTISVLLPVRDEVQNFAACTRSVLTQPEVSQLVILDDGSIDGTTELVAELADSDPRVTITDPGEFADPPPAWLGKNWACHRMSKQATGSVLVFLDADVVLKPGAISRSVTLLREYEFDMVSPYPRQLADGLLPRLVQPLLQWSWLTFVPLRISESRQLPSMAVGNGQFFAIDAAAYTRIGGHGAVCDRVIEDVALARILRRAGGRTAVTDGTDLATCRMYTSNAGLIDGYTKSLWCAFGRARGAVAGLVILTGIYVVPPLAIVVGPTRKVRVWGLVGYGAAVTGRLVVARRTEQRTFPDVLAQPLSILALAGLTVTSLVRKHNGTLTWKGRRIASR